MSLLVRNVRLWKNISFDEYLKLPGWSYSGIKGAKIEPTPKMLLGTAVHAYLLSPSEYNHDHFIVPALAKELRMVLGPLLQFATPELAVTAEFVYEGMVMCYKGRIDLPVVMNDEIGNPLNLVIDLKITEMDTRKGIDFFGYHHQVNGYALAIGAQRMVIVSANPAKLKRREKATQVIPIQRDIRFWEQSVLKFGRPIPRMYTTHVN